MQMTIKSNYLLLPSFNRSSFVWKILSDLSSYFRGLTIMILSCVDRHLHKADLMKTFYFIEQWGTEFKKKRAENFKVGNHKWRDSSLRTSWLVCSWCWCMWVRGDCLEKHMLARFKSITPKISSGVNSKTSECVYSSCITFYMWHWVYISQFLNVFTNYSIYFINANHTNVSKVGTVWKLFLSILTRIATG